jgi:1-phosphofructokinase family hexose kinase
MILTVTISPLLERRLTFRNVLIGKNNRDGRPELRAGGKGINVSRQLNAMGQKNFAFTMLGGQNGKIYKELLFNEHIDFSSINIKQQTRYASVIIDESSNTVSTYFEENNTVLKEESDLFKEKLEKMIQNCEIVVFSGSSLCAETDDIFPYGISIANKYDKVSICDTYGKHLQACIDNSPTIIHNNIEEISSSLNLQLDNEDKKFEMLDSFYQKGVKQAYLTDGEGEIYASNFDFHYTIKPLKAELKDATGSGDAFTAGLAYGWHKDLTFMETVKIASAAGVLNAASFDTCNVPMDYIEQLKDKVEVIPSGKKMKIIDDRPQ